MGYRTNANLPFIAKAPNNNGVYKDLYSSVAKKIGCKLEIIRKTKKEILEDLRIGLIDLYPGIDIDEFRASYLHFIPNYLPGNNIGLSHSDFWTVFDLEMIQKEKIIEPAGGAHKYDTANNQIIEFTDLNITEAVHKIAKKEGSFFVTNETTVEYYFKENPNVDGIKLHPYCCLKNNYMSLGFSLASMHINPEPNPNYLPRKNIKHNNLPFTIKENCIAKKIQLTLEEMFHSGETNEIFNRHFFNFNYEG